MEKEQPKCFAILKASKISVNELPEEIREKIEILTAVIDSRKSVNMNDERELRDWALRVDARDDAVLSELQSYVAKKKKEQATQQQGEQTENSQEQDKPQQMGWGGRIIIENKPKWMFW